MSSSSLTLRIGIHIFSCFCEALGGRYELLSDRTVRLSDSNEDFSIGWYAVSYKHAAP